MQSVTVKNLRKLQSFPKSYRKQDMIDALEAAGVDVSGLSVDDKATADHSAALGQAQLTEKTNDSDDFQTHTITLDVGKSGEKGYGSDAQTLFWEIRANGGEGEASLNDFVETSGYVDLAADAETATIDLKVVIGPCIAKNNYEIKDDFFRKFKKQDKKNKSYFKKRKKRKFFDMTKYVVDNIKSEGIEEIEIIKKDTFPENNNFFSARRALKKNENDYGRNISIIMLN